MQTFLLPYIVQGKPIARLFAKVAANTISAAAAMAEEQIRKSFRDKTGERVCVAVAEIDFTFRDRETGKPIVNPQPPRRRRRRNQGGMWR